MLTPLLIVLVSASFIAGRAVLARQQVDDAARTAAEAASIASSPTGASYAASVTAIANVLDDALFCEDLTVHPSTTDFRPGGSVSVSVACTMPLSRLGFLGLPGSVRLVASRWAPIEPYRQLSP